MPYRSSTENATIAARKLTHALQNPSPASPFSNVGDKQMEALHQLSGLFQKSVTKNNEIPKSIAPPRIYPTWQSTQARVPIRTTPAHNAHPHRSKNIEDNHRNQPLGVNHGNQPLGLGLPPQRKTAELYYIPPVSVTSPRVARIHRQPVTSSTRMKQPPRYQTRSYTLRPNSISARYIDAANYIAITEANSVTHPITGQAQEYLHLIKGDDKDTWETSSTNNLGRLTQGVGNRIEGTNTINFRQKSAVPKNKKVTYGRLVCDSKEDKTEIITHD